MNDTEAHALLRDCGALLEGHFLLSSGRHSGKYIEKFRILEQPRLTERLAGEMAARFKDERVTLVAGLSTGGALIAHEVAKALQCRFLFAERVSGQLTLRRGFRIERGVRVLVVEDVLTTGASVQELIKLLCDEGGQVIGLACLVQRGEPHFDLPFFALMKLPLETYSADSCPLCTRGIPLETRGSRLHETPL
jgi:orotate phosphoribosyltransferase